MDTYIQLDIVSAERALYSGKVKAVFVSGTHGELGIYPGHTPLLTTLRPGEVRSLLENDHQDLFYISGGLLEVQPDVITVLADTAIRAADIDEAAALEAQRRAEALLSERKGDFDYAVAATELAQAIAQLRALRKVRKQSGV